MALPNVVINLANGQLGRADIGDDGIAGMVLTGTAVAGKMELGQVYLFGSSSDITLRGITADNNPLAYKELTAFFAKTSDSGELYVILVAPATLLTDMCSLSDDSPIRKLVQYSKGSIRLIGINRIPPEGYVLNTATTGIDKDAVDAGEAAHELAEAYAAKIMPFRVLIPALGWDGKTEKLYKPRESSYNRVQYIMASDDATNKTAAIGQVLGRLAKYAINYSAARVKHGAMVTNGYLTNGKTPEECESLLNILDTAGYVIYRFFPKKNGYYLNDDAMAAPRTDDYSNMTYARAADKAMVITYGTYVEEIQDDIEVADDGTIPVEMCSYYERLITSAIGQGMQNEISKVEVYVDPDQDILSTEIVRVKERIVPRGMVRGFEVDLGFKNPSKE